MIGKAAERDIYIYYIEIGWREATKLHRRTQRNKDTFVAKVKFLNRLTSTTLLQRILGWSSDEYKKKKEIGKNSNPEKNLPRKKIVNL